MQSPMTAVEMTGVVDDNNQLMLDGELPLLGPRRVRVIVLTVSDDEIDEGAWLRAASRNSAFNFLKDPAEDIYTVNDGKPFSDEI